MRWSFLPSWSNVILTIYFIGSLCINGGISPLAKRGFFCTDLSIYYPDRPDTIGFKTLVFICLFTPMIVIKYCDIFVKRKLLDTETTFKRQRKISVNQRLAEGDEEDSKDVEKSLKRRLLCEDNETNMSDQDSLAGEPAIGSKFKHSVQQKPGPIRTMIFGACTNMWLTGICKIASGRLRPHFIDRCKPDIDCTARENLMRYIEDFNCTNFSKDSRSYYYITTSWPSGHASWIFYTAIYMIIYLHHIQSIVSDSRRKNAVSSWLNPLMFGFLYTIVVSLAIYISLTRVSDYHHHPLDVLSGVILGSVLAVAISKLVNFHKKH